MVTTHLFRRLAALVVATAAICSTVRAGDWLPLLPDQDFYDFQLFAPPDLQEYGIYHRPSEGIFFSYDRLYWAVTVPRVTRVAETSRGGYLIPSQPLSPQSIVQLNNGGIIGSGTAGGSVIGGIFIYGSDPLQLDLNTSWLRTGLSWGNRYEGGWIYDDRGMLFSYFNTGDQKQQFQTNSEFAASSPTQIFTQVTTAGAAGFGAVAEPLTTTTITSNSPPPDHLVAQKLTQVNSTELMSVSASAIIRRELGRRGSGTTVRFSLGPRYVQFADRFRLGYESNQYAWNTGPSGGTQGGGVNISTPGSTPGGGVNIGGQQGGGNQQPCWVAREVYGETNPRWLLFRAWLLTEAPDWLRELYLAHGAEFATWIHDKPLLKAAIRTLMDQAIARSVAETAVTNAEADL
jgi:hypothetical protein